MSEDKNKISLNDKIVNFVFSNWVSIIFILFVLFILFIYIPYFIPFLTEKHKITCNLNDKGEIGDTIGGLTAPIIGLFSAFLVYIAFREQKKANDELMSFNEKQIQITEFQNLKIILDYIHEIGDNIEIKRDQVIIGFNNCIKVIFKLSESIKYLGNIQDEIDIDQFINLKYKLHLFKEKVESSKLTELDKQFLIYDIHNKYFINYFEHFSFEEYIEIIDTDIILKNNKDITIIRANYYKRLVECLDQFHKY